MRECRFIFLRHSLFKILDEINKIDEYTKVIIISMTDFLIIIRCLFY